jgi:hypothetical protein
MQFFLVEARHVRKHDDLLDRFVHINIGPPDAFVIFEGWTHQMKDLIHRFLKLIFKIAAEINFYVSHFRRPLDRFFDYWQNYSDSMTICKGCLSTSGHHEEIVLFRKRKQ